MGILDIFKKKKPSEKSKEPQRFLLPSSSQQEKDTETIVNVAGTARINFPIYAKQVNESIKIIRTTTNPNTFFYRYGFIIERLTEMEKIEQYIDYQHTNSYEMKQTIINDKDQYIACLIGRMFEKTKEKIGTLKRQYDIELNIDVFLSSVENFSEEMGEQSKKYFKEVTEYLKVKYLNNMSDNMKIETVTIHDEIKEEKQILSQETVSASNSDFQHTPNVNLEIENQYNSGSYAEEKFREIKELTEKSYPSRNGLKIPEIKVLNRAENFTTETKDIHGFWYYEYGLELEDIHNILNMLMRKKFIEIAPAKEMIKKFTVAKIKELLKESGLKQSGRKAELLERLFTNTNDEYLESKVNKKGFMLTDTGKQELKENDYVIYLHRLEGRLQIHFNVWQMNKKLHDNPEKTYREIMWEDLQKQYKIELHEIRHKGYKTYTMLCNDICTFLLEAKGNAEIALKYFAESTYYEINYNTAKQYSLHMAFYNSESQKPEPAEVYNSTYIDEKNFNKIQEELDISDDELCRRLDNIFFAFHVEKPMLSDIDTAKFIIAKVKKDYETLDEMEYVIDESVAFVETESSFDGFDFTEIDKQAIERLEQKGRSKPKIRHYTVRKEIKWTK